MVDSFSVEAGNVLLLCIDSVAPGWRQGVGLTFDQPVVISGMRIKPKTLVTIWQDNAPPTVRIKPRAFPVAVSVKNIWDNGSGRADSWMGNAAMMVDIEGNLRLYRCNDMAPDEDFDDIMFRIGVVPDEG